MKFQYLVKAIFAAGLGLSVMACTGQIEPIKHDDTSKGLAPHYYAQLQDQTCCTIIAHAGGAIDGNAYTNSREAVERNYAYGTRLFELDFDQTRDGHWVATHDWPNWKAQTGYVGDLPPSRSDYMSSPRKYKKVSWSIEGEYNAIDMGWLEAFLDEHSDALIVTDMKELDKFPDFVETILKSSHRSQFIFQAYSIDDIALIKSRSPQAKIILTMYRIGYPASLFTSLKDKKSDLIGVTVPMSWAHVDSVTERLLDIGLPIYLHGAPWQQDIALSA